jgi:hypothetical protein
VCFDRHFYLYLDIEKRQMQDIIAWNSSNFLNVIFFPNIKL